MKTIYAVKITETLSRTINVLAVNEQDAKDFVVDMYHDDKLELTAEDFEGVTVTVEDIAVSMTDGDDDNADEV